MEFTKQQTIKTSVVACVIDERERVLLTRRCIEPFCSLWVMPGGKIDHGESILAALHREVREEVGIDIHVEGLIDVFEHIGVGDRRDHFVILYYRAKPLSLALQPNGDECTEAIWAIKSCLPKMALPPGGRHILTRVFPDLPWSQPRPEELVLSEELPGGRLNTPAQD
ncbi:NUDIX domain-containing protein [Geoalkalibacter sp.]|uniref:NUDIX domain-containing protein n=1 Tax=Geoalkalibacter sp. TaxID=3041440 RepID=UPI00272EBC14|nr:NUDIX hydrolase [Geoalkalibacter sp.]